MLQIPRRWVPHIVLVAAKVSFCVLHVRASRWLHVPESNEFVFSWPEVYEGDRPDSDRENYKRRVRGPRYADSGVGFSLVDTRFVRSCNAPCPTLSCSNYQKSRPTETVLTPMNLLVDQHARVFG